MSRVKVLVTGPSLLGSPGGIRTHVLHIRTAFASSDVVEIKHLPVTPGLHDGERWGARLVRFVRSLSPFVRAVSTADVIHLNSTFDNRSLIRDGIHLAVARFILRKPVIVQFHGGQPAATGILRHRSLRSLFAFLLMETRLVLILSKLQGSQFHSLFPRVVYRIVPNYIDCDISNEFAKSDQPRTLRFLFMGRIHQNKGIREIVEAATIVSQRRHEFVVELCGEGPAAAWLKEAVSLRTAESNHPYLIYSGPVDGCQKLLALQRCDVMLLPSLHEGFPYAMLEAAKFSMPIIATAVGGIPDFVVHGYNGRLISAPTVQLLAEEMEYAIQHPEAIREMGWRARLKVESDFSFDCLRRTFQRIYIDAAGAGCAYMASDV